jgi:predicted ATPase
MIERLALKNFKSIKDEIFDLEGLTLFSGLNGMGKSTVLQSMLLLRQSFEKHMLPNTGLSLTGEYINIGIGSDLLFNDAEEEYIEIGLYWSDSSLDLHFDYRKTSDMQPIQMDEHNLTGSPFEESLFSSSFQYLSAERISPKTIYDVSDYAVNQHRSVGAKGEYTAHFLAEHGNEAITIKDFKHSSASTEYLIDNLNAWMSEITPGTKVIAKVIPEINKASLHYKFSNGSELTGTFRPENTGFGLTYVLPVVTAILSARSGDLLLIENPESHLHPAGQSLVAKLVAIAAENDVQIIVETHSDHFLNGIRMSVKSGLIDSDNVCAYFLSRDIDNSEHSALVEKVRIEDSGRINYWPKGFFDEWEKTLNVLIESN